MKKQLFYLVSIVLLLTACAKDKGNYDYVDVPSPTVAHMDSLYTVVIGDSLIISPSITINSKGGNNYSLHWSVAVPELLSSIDFDGKELHMLFALGATSYNARLTITDENNGQKYFRNFVIKGVTEFTKGTVILSTLADHSALSFVTTGDSLMSDIYGKLNTTPLPPGGVQLCGPLNHNLTDAYVDKIWVRYTGNGSGVVNVNTTNMLKQGDLLSNFFGDPGAVNAEGLYETSGGTANGIFSGQFYWGYTYTYGKAPEYGKWGTSLIPINSSKYYLSNQFVQTDAYQLGFDTLTHSFMWIGPGNTFFGNINLMVTPPADTSIFNPTKLKKDIVYMHRFSDDKMFAVADSAGKKKFELRFAVQFQGILMFSPQSMTRFKGDSLVTANTLWDSSPLSITYFTSGSDIYAYNLDNKFLTKLATSFSGQTISMLKVMDEGATLAVGVPGKVVYLNTSTGHNGDIKKTTDGIPGAPTDILVLDN